MLGDHRILSLSEAIAMRDGQQTLDVGRLLDTAITLLLKTASIDAVHESLLTDGYVKGTVPEIDLPDAGDVCQQCHTPITVEAWYKKQSDGFITYRALAVCRRCNIAFEF